VKARDVNAVLTLAALYDPRMKRVDAVEQADMAAAWAELLVGVDIDAALAAVKAHYSVSRDAIMPADILDRVGWEPPSTYENITARVAAAQKKAELEKRGITEDELEKHKHDPAWIREHFSDAMGSLQQ